MTFEPKTTNLTTADLAGTASRSEAREPDTLTTDNARVSTSPQTTPGARTDMPQRDVPASERVSDGSPVIQSREDSAPTTEEHTGGVGRTPAGSTGAPSSGGSRGHVDAEATPLFPANEAEQYRARWTDIQAGFVDEPRRAVEGADGLVADVMKRLAETFAQERSTLESQWDRGDSMDTEQLRLALRRYRSFFDRLLSV